MPSKPHHDGGGERSRQEAPGLEGGAKTVRQGGLRGVPRSQNLVQGGEGPLGGGGGGGKKSGHGKTLVWSSSEGEQNTENERENIDGLGIRGTMAIEARRSSAGLPPCVQYRSEVVPSVTRAGGRWGGLWVG